MRSAELHYYAAGGSVADPSHRDQGSLLTLSVLLSEPSEYEGGVLTTAGERRHELARGDGLCFVSEQARARTLYLPYLENLQVPYSRLLLSGLTYFLTRSSGTT